MSSSSSQSATRLRSRSTPRRRQVLPLSRATIACALALSLWVGLVEASPHVSVIEFDATAEALLDTRATRRLVDLEIKDVDVPPAEGHEEAALFFRVLGAEQSRIRVELWERGESHGVRLVSAADGGRLGARRVALAAAELARLLRASRIRERRLAERERARQAERERIARERTLDGPVALRSTLSGELAGAGDLWLFGPTLSLELSTPPFGRVDLGLGLRGGELDASGSGVESLEAELGFAHRFVLTDRLDLDAGLGARAGVLTLGGVQAVDAISGQAQTWWSRAFAVVRIQPRLSRELRLDAGALGGVLLRSVPFRAQGRDEQLEGFWFGAELGIVLTPTSR